MECLGEIGGGGNGATGLDWRESVTNYLGDWCRQW